MPHDDISQELALLPEGIAESNLNSWEKIVSFYKGFVDNPIGDILPESFHDKILYFCNLDDDLMPALQSLLNRLWSETRGRS
jgi:hypothetical protein